MGVRHESSQLAHVSTPGDSDQQRDRPQADRARGTVDEVLTAAKQFFVISGFDASRNFLRFGW